MKLPISIQSYMDWKYSHYVTCFCAGAGLELFMNFFHVGEVNIYRSIKRSLSDSRAESKFEAERLFFEKINSSEDDD